MWILGWNFSSDLAIIMFFPKENPNSLEHGTFLPRRKDIVPPWELSHSRNPIEKGTIWLCYRTSNI